MQSIRNNARTSSNQLIDYTQAFQDQPPRTNSDSTDMCIQVDKRWTCGHIGYFKIIWCKMIFKTCKGTSATHEVIDVAEVCDDCERRITLPEPHVAK